MKSKRITQDKAVYFDQLYITHPAVNCCVISDCVYYQLFVQQR